MAFLHRKLLNASYGDTVCEPFCDEEKNPNGICPVSCMNYLCFNCKTVDFPPPPLPPPPPTTYVDHIPSKHHKLSLLVTVSLVIVSTLVFLLACYTIYKFCINRYNLRRRRFLQPGEQEPSPDAFLDEDQGPNQGPEVEHHIWYIRTIGLEPSVISAITICKYKKGEGLIEGTDCSVCLNEFQEDETLRLLPKCSHAFHIPCIDTWLRSHTNCPLCRAGIMNNTANLPSPELIVHNSGPVEGNLSQISESSEVATMEESRNEDSELGIGTEDDRLTVVENGLVGIQPVRRSASMDALSASMVTAAAANASSAQSQRNSDDDQLNEVKELNEGIVAKRDGNGISERLLRLVGGLSIERPSCIKRSLSCSANV